MSPLGPTSDADLPPHSGPADPAARRRISGLEWAAVALLLLAGAFPRGRDLDGPYDRHFEGWQGAFFTTAAINFERLGADALAGYPILNIDVTPTSDPATWYIYPNHPPTVPWMAWAGAELLGPDDWGEAWQRGQAPVGVEPFVRFPFFLASLLGAFALWWAVRQAGGIQQALLALALWAVLPLPALYGTLVNYEVPSLPGVLFAYGFYARWVRAPSPRALVGVAASFALAGTVTYAPCFFVPPLVMHAFVRRGWRSSFVVGATASAGVLLPLAVHAVWVRSALAGIGQAGDGLVARIGRLLGPMLDGSLPLDVWVGYQLERCAQLFTLPVCVAAVAGLVWAVRPGRPREQNGPVALGPLLALGGLFTLLGYYRHTFDEPPQDPFLLNVAPAFAVLAAAALNALSIVLYRLRGGVAPLVVATSVLALPALTRMAELRREWRLPGRFDVESTETQVALGPATPLPSTAGREIAELLPAGAVGLHPMELGFSLSVSYYAWRTLFGVTTAETGAGSYEHVATLLGAIGLADAPRYVILPLDVPPHAADAVATARERMEALGAPALETAKWQAWRIEL